MEEEVDYGYLGLHQQGFNLYQTPHKFYINPIDTTELLIINKSTCEISIDSMSSEPLLGKQYTSTFIYGIIGIKHLILSPYLIVITKATQIGSIEERPIFRMDSAELIPFIPWSSGAKATEWNIRYVSMMESILKTPSFYFSYTYDLTNSLQRIVERDLRLGTRDRRVHLNYDKRFLWNNHLMENFNNVSKDVSHYSCKYHLPLIHGFVRINNTTLGSKTNFVLISRRSVHRAGTRFNCRGVDNNGHVANFVETEQIFIEHKSMKASFVQVRGSIPLIWSQQVNYKYKPDIVIDPHQDQVTPLRKHLEELCILYGNVSIVNLIDQRGHEGRLEHEFSQRMRQEQSNFPIPYHYFDFHKECSKMRWHRLSILMERIDQEIKSYGYFADYGQEQEVVRWQTGVIRSNCIDSLDRTNVVQSMIAQKVLEQQLESFRLIPNGSKLSDYGEMLRLFKETWADNADALSIQYAGTPALKTDFTRTGQRTNIGMIRDGINSLTRYVSNNFFDFYRQDAIDLFLGNYKSDSYPSPLYRPLALTSNMPSLPTTIVILVFIGLYIYLRSLYDIFI